MVMPNGKVYGIHPGDPFPIWEINPTERGVAIVHLTSIASPNSLRGFVGITNIPYSQTSTQFLVLGSGWYLYFGDLVHNTLTQIDTNGPFASLSSKTFIFYLN